jgi:hypothetical protein
VQEFRVRSAANDKVVVIYQGSFLQGFSHNGEAIIVQRMIRGVSISVNLLWAT